MTTEHALQTARRRTFAIVSHPDAGKTTLTEKLLLFGGAIQMAGAVKARKASRHATSDWMEIEKQRGISVASSVMQASLHCLVRTGLVIEVRSHDTIPPIEGLSLVWQTTLGWQQHTESA